MKCPKCGLYNSDNAMRCDCGYDFDTNTMKDTFLSEKAAMPTRGHFIGGWIFAFLGGYIGIYIAYQIAFGKNKEGYKYDPDARRIGKYMLAFAIFMALFWTILYALIKG